MRMEVVAASGRPPKGWFDGGGDLDRERVGEDESECKVTKLMRWRYLRLRQVTAELQVASATWIGAPER